MDFNLTAEQEALRDSVRRFTEREYDFERRKAVLRSEKGVSPQHWAVFAELGWLGAGLSEEQGGFGGGAVENAVIAEEIGRALVTEPFVAHVLATQLLAGIGTEASSGLIAALVMGERRIVAAVQEVEARGDFRQVAAVAVPDGSGWRLSGGKSLVEGGSTADRLIVSARVGEDLRLFLVDPASAGVQRQDYRTLDNRRVADFTFSDAKLDSDAVLVSGPGVADLIECAVDHAIVAMGAEALGAMDAALWATRDYLRTRKQFGVAIGSFQALQHRMADMLIEVELTRSALFHALGALQSDDADIRRAGASALKVQAAHAGLFVGTQAIQLHGGIGVTEELIIGHYYRRLYVAARQFGDADMHLARFAASRDTLASR